MSDRLTAWLRTVVPALWASLVAYLVAQFGLPDGLATFLGGLGEQLIVPAALAGVYALLRGLEPHLPNWLTVILLGSSRPPTYPAGTNGGMHAA